MASLYHNTQLIADILSVHSDLKALEERLSHPEMDWETLVALSSKHLVMPAVYCRLKDKKLLDVLPEDLIAYLDEMTTINRNRNTTILGEIQAVSTLFTDAGIDHVFLKGAALLASGAYSDLGERMVGDIDILVQSDQLFEAQNLLVNHGYNEIKTTFGYEYFENKHLKRLIPQTKLASIEIHRRVLEKPVKGQLDPVKVLRDKQMVEGIAVACPNDLLSHAVLNFQINDHGYYFNFLGLRNAYDALILTPKVSKLERDTLLKQHYIRSFFKKLSVFFDLSSYFDQALSSRFYKKRFVFKLNTRWLHRLQYGLLNAGMVLGLIVNRLYHILTNSDYRKASFKDRKRLFQLIKKRIYPF